jgi:NOL1/NOP2/fmu family ribosome biogenesis protein
MIKKCSPEHQSLLLAYLETRFGIEQHLFENFSFYAASKDRIFLGPKTLIDRPPPVSAGILIARLKRAVKPTTNFFQIFGKYVKNNSIAFNKEQALRFIRGEDLELSADEIRDASDGYVLLTYLDFPLGCGLLKRNHIKNMIPKVKWRNLKFL